MLDNRLIFADRIMNYTSLEECLLDLEKNGHLIRVKEEVDPYLEMSAIHLKVFENNGPALLFENVKGSQFRAASNIFGTLERSKFIFRSQFKNVQGLVKLKSNPIEAIKNPISNLSLLKAGLSALPRKESSTPLLKNKISIADLPQIQCWPKDGGAFITLPQVFSEDIDKPGIGNSNLGMYRIQLGGNQYVQNKEIGLHYQLHRGIGVHQTIANVLGKPLKVSVFVGGPPSHSLAAVMPLPEGLSELSFAGAIGGRRFRYSYDEGFAISNDADFVITGEVYPGENKPEGSFGDHLGYYSLTHDFPVMRVKAVYHKKNAIWPFTVVGRPPQEDTQFGALIHELTGDAIPNEIPGLKEVHAVDASGVHPLLLAIGSERYTPYSTLTRPQEILTIANHILGTGQLSLAKYLFILAPEKNHHVSCHKEKSFFEYFLKRADWKRDVHFYTQTSIDTLDYSGDGLNTGSKVVFAAVGEEKFKLCSSIAGFSNLPNPLKEVKLVIPGVVSLQCDSSSKLCDVVSILNNYHQNNAEKFDGIRLIVLADDSPFVAKTWNNFLWVTFTRSNPANDIRGIGEFTENKHWGCTGPIIIDARKKTHHAPELEMPAEIWKKVESLAVKGKSLHGII